MAITKNLKIPKLEPQNVFDVVKDVNAAIDATDSNALPISHVDSKAHFAMWQPNTKYKKGDVVRTTTIPLWGFWEAVQNDTGTSATVEPIGTGIDDTFTDGTVTWTLRKMGGSGQDKNFGENADGELTYKGTPVYKDTRVIVFMGTSWQVSYPYTGEIVKVTALCPTTLTTPADFEIQKISSTDYATGGKWKVLGNGAYNISTDKTYAEWAISDNNSLTKNDIVRISSDAQNLDMTVFQLYVKNY